MSKAPLHTPEGVRDIYNDEIIIRQNIIDKLSSLTKSYGYDKILTPTLEYLSVYYKDITVKRPKDFYKLYDKDGDTMVLRPDFTPSIARAATKYFSDDKPLRLYYEGSVFANNKRYQGRLMESCQFGGELIGDDSINSDAEIVTIVSKSLISCGLDNYVISIGHADIVRELISVIGCNDDEAITVKDYIRNHNIYDLAKYLRTLGYDESIIKLCSLVCRMYKPDSDEWKELLIYTSSYDKLNHTLMYLDSLYKELECEDGSNISFEPATDSDFDYYTGIILAAYTPGVGEPVATGGRYDNLLANFGEDRPAIGFGIFIDELQQAMKHNSKSEYITVALGKGRLARKAMQLFEQINLPCKEIYDKDTRKLIFVNDEAKIRFFLAKVPDVPTYVEYGAADIGIVGLDTILEEGRSIFDVLDLGFGACKMCICGPGDAKDLLKGKELIRVASKYPKITRDYFHNHKNQTVEIIKLNGSIELAPILGLSDVICDIVETGTTLRENGLEVLEEVAELSARVVVNPVSLRLDNQRITDIIYRLSEVLS